ncbi:hypothetical protein CMV_029495 [Castanea mollissima]|uniref:O-fucosyltransferase family protein n=1 Tax=Castanea mollissima TaxID=60419 RepID=A0A8J4Q6J6_9ROSI|nr:hypothetical protein CMV_029495 [Castanea mollissima]
MAAILNRTLIVPPVLDHHAVALGSCPKFRVSDPNKIRVDVWNHVVELLRTGRYVSMADIIDISSLVSSSVIQTIDFRVFASLWCGVKDFDCFNESNEQSSLFDSLKQCGSLLSGLNGNVDKCVHAVGEDCRTTVWTYQNGEKDGVLDSFQPDEQLKRKKKVSYVRRRRDVYQTLGPSSATESATLLAFGSLFTSPYRGKEFADKNINAYFLCAQLRLLDGQFKNHWKATFLSLKQKIESLGQSPLPIHIFVMTDLPEGNWTGSYLGDLARDSLHFKLHFLREEDELVIKTAKKVVAAKHSLRFAFVPESVGGLKKHCPSERLPDVLLFIEEAVCSCASLGFVGTAGSTIAESVELMRKFGTCASQSLTAFQHFIQIFCLLKAQKTVKEEISSCQDSTPLRLQLIEGQCKYLTFSRRRKRIN